MCNLYGAFFVQIDGSCCREAWRRGGGKRQQEFTIYSFIVQGALTEWVRIVGNDGEYEAVYARQSKKRTPLQQ